MDSPVETALIILFVVALFGVIIGVVIWAIYTAVRQNKTTNAEFEGLKTIHGEAAAQGSHNTLTFIRAMGLFLLFKDVFLETFV